MNKEILTSNDVRIVVNCCSKLMKFHLCPSTKSVILSCLLLGVHIHCAASTTAAPARNDESEVKAINERIREPRSGPLLLADKPENEDSMKMYIQARSLMQQGETASAVQVLEKLCEHDPTFLSGWTQYGIALQSLGRVKESIVAFKKVVELEPNKARYWSNLANAYLAEQDYELAADAFKHTLDLDASVPQAHESYGFVLTKLGKDKQAKEQLLETVKIDPESANAWSILGGVNLRLNQHKDAREAYTEYLRLRPKATDARQISDTLKMLGKAPSKDDNSPAEKTKGNIENKGTKGDAENKGDGEKGDADKSKVD